MIKIEESEARQSLTSMDLKVITQEIDDIYQSDQRFDREMTAQYFSDDENIYLKVYWDEKEVAHYRFDNKLNKLKTHERSKRSDFTY